MSVLNKERAVTEFLTAENVPPVGINLQMKAVYGADCAGIRLSDGEGHVAALQTGDTAA
jgi:hypothetical protein